MAPEEACEKEMFVEIDWEGDTRAVPLIQLEAIADVDEETQQAKPLPARSLEFSKICSKAYEEGVLFAISPIAKTMDPNMDVV